MGYALLSIGAFSLILHGARSWTAWVWVSGLVWWLAAFRPWNLLGEKTGAWWVWALWISISAAASVEPWTSSSAIFRPLTYVLFFTLCAGSFQERHRRYWLAGLWVLGASFGLYAVCFRNAGWLPPNQNYTGCLTAATLASIVAVWAHPKSRMIPWQSAAAALSALIAVLSLSYIDSRGAIMAVIFVSAALIVRRGGARALIGLLAAAAAALFFIPASWIEHASKVGNEANMYRPLIWKVGYLVARDFPILGIGPGCYARGYLLHNFPAFDGVSYYGRSTDNAHSEILQLAAESGWIAAVLWVMAFAGTLRQALKKAWTDAHPARLAAAAAAATVFIHSLMDGILFLPGLQFLLFSALACGASDRKPGSGEDSGPLWLRRCAGIGLALCCAANVMSRIPPMKLWMAPADYSLHVAAAREAVLRRPPDPAEALVHIDRAIEWNPTDAASRLMKADLFGTVGDWSGAARSAWRAAGLEPNFVMAHLVLSDALYRLGDRPGARREIDRVQAILNDPELPKNAGGYDGYLLALDSNRLSALRRALAR